MYWRGRSYLERLRNTPIKQGDRDHLRLWLNYFVGIDLASEAVCADHVAPFDIFASLYFDQPSTALILGPRGGGKSMGSAVLAHLRARWNREYGARIMGGSLEQSKQIYSNIEDLMIVHGGPRGRETDQIKALRKQEAEYVSGARIRILPASRKAARGPHVPDIFLDEVDEMKKDVYESAVGMAQGNAARGLKTSIVQTSTWHNEQGLMGRQIEHAREAGTPFYQYCIFEVLERCPTERSGPNLEKCPKCPIVKWCHADIDVAGKPKAKRSSGHYEIESLIQKAMLIGENVINSDFLCNGPKSEGVWFTAFNDDNVATDSMIARGWCEYSDQFHTYIPIDYGVYTGAVVMQFRPRNRDGRIVEDLHIIDEYLNDNATARENASLIAAKFSARMQGLDVNHANLLIDPASSARNPIGPAGLAEYRAGGLRHVKAWPNMTGRKLESLDLLNAFVKDGTGERHLFIHPRCKLTIQAFRYYARKKRGDVYSPDEPADPQHPWEDLIDPICGALLHKYPHGRDAKPRGTFRIPVPRI